MSEKPADKKAKRKKAHKPNLELALTPEGSGGALNIKHKAWSPHQIPSWEFWLDMPEVELWQACALSLNVDPDSVAPSNDGMGGGSYFEEPSFPNEKIWIEFNKRRRLLKANIKRQNGYDPHSIGLDDFVRLVLNLSYPWDMPQELMIFAQKPEVQTSAPPLMTDTMNKAGNGENEKVEIEIENKDSGNIPGKQPNIAIRKLAVKAAWEIEQKTKKRTTAIEVMTKLQNWADEAKYSETLRHSNRDKRSVSWVTNKGVKKNYTIEACQVTLKDWWSSRD